MDIQILLVFVILAYALYLFIREVYSIETTAIIVMVLLIVTRIVTPEEGVSGFSNPATITVLCMFILSAGIKKTGLIQTLGDKLLKITKRSQNRQLIAISVIAGPLSGFINNTALVAVMLPMVKKLANQTKTYASRLLIPLSFVSMAGGMLTVIGTSTNILAAAIYASAGYGIISLFAFIKLGAIVLVTTILYFLLFGRFLLPIRHSTVDEDPHEKLIYHAEIVVNRDSKLIGQVLKDSPLKKNFKIDFLQIKRHKRFIDKVNREKLHPGDVLLVNATREELLKVRQYGLVEMKGHIKFPEKKAHKYSMIQLMVSSTSLLINHTLQTIKFREKYQAVVFGIRRGDAVLREGLTKVKLKFGDILLIRATEKALSKLRQHKDFTFIGDVPELFNSKKTWYAIGIFSVVILLAALRVEIMVAALIGLVLMVIFKVISFEEGYSAVNWDVIILLAGLIPLGIAIQKSGAASLIANTIVSISGNISPIILLGIIYIITTILTNIISNNAAVIVILPIVLTITQELSLNPFAFTLGVMFAASTSFLTPIGYQTNTMVYSAGNYKFNDFIKVGLPLNIILMIVTTYFISKFWGL